MIKETPIGDYIWNGSILISCMITGYMLLRSGRRCGVLIFSKAGCNIITEAHATCSYTTTLGGLPALRERLPQLLLGRGLREGDRGPALARGARHDELTRAGPDEVVHTKARAGSWGSVPGTGQGERMTETVGSRTGEVGSLNAKLTAEIVSPNAELTSEVAVLDARIVNHGWGCRAPEMDARFHAGDARGASVPFLHALDGCRLGLPRASGPRP